MFKAMKKRFHFKTGQAKDFKSYDELLDILKNRGLIINDRLYALSILKRISYYRLSAYSLSLRKNDTFYNNVTFENIVELYKFDEEFRQLILNYSSIIEISFRNHIAHYHSEKYGPLGYLDSNNFEDTQSHSVFINKLEDAIDRSDDVFVYHHKTDKGCVFPFWVAIESSTFGELSKCFKNLHSEDKTKISKTYIGRSRKYVENWLQCCTYVRNIAAHGGRFYNRKLKSCPVKLSKSIKTSIDNTSPFAFVIALYNLLETDDSKESLVNGIEMIIAKYPFANIKHLGFPQDWKNYFTNNHQDH